MIFKNSLNKGCIKFNAELKTKDDVLKEIAGMALKSDYLKKLDEKTIYKALKDREKLASTGFGNGIAVPHCSFPDIEDFTVGFLATSNPVDFKAIDNEPVNIFFFIIGPENQRNRHIQILSGISKILADKDSLDSIKKVENADDLAAIMDQDEKTVSIKDADNYEKCIFNIMVQNEKYFNDILEILSSEPDTYITVLDSNNAGYYLRKQPLFSAFWTESENYFNKLVIAVTRKSYCNNIIRRINIIDESLPTENNVLINVQDLFYSNGSIDF